MNDDKERTMTDVDPAGHAPAPEPCLATATGEMLDDDELDSLCDATLTSIVAPGRD